MLVKDTVCLVFLIFQMPALEFTINVSNSSLNNSFQVISYRSN